MNEALEKRQAFKHSPLHIPRQGSMKKLMCICSQRRMVTDVCITALRLLVRAMCCSSLQLFAHGPRKDSFLWHVLTFKWQLKSIPLNPLYVRILSAACCLLGLLPALSICKHLLCKVQPCHLQSEQSASGDAKAAHSAV